MSGILSGVLRRHSRKCSQREREEETHGELVRNSRRNFKENLKRNSSKTPRDKNSGGNSRRTSWEDHKAEIHEALIAGEFFMHRTSTAFESWITFFDHLSRENFRLWSCSAAQVPAGVRRGLAASRAAAEGSGSGTQANAVVCMRLFRSLSVSFDSDSESVSEWFRSSGLEADNCGLW